MHCAIHVRYTIALVFASPLSGSNISQLRLMSKREPSFEMHINDLHQSDFTFHRLHDFIYFPLSQGHNFRYIQKKKEEEEEIMSCLFVLLFIIKHTINKI